MLEDDDRRNAMHDAIARETRDGLKWPPTNQSSAVVEEAANLRRFIENCGYRRCDTPACNCGSFHGGHAEARLSEIREALEADMDMNGLTILDAVRALLAERQPLREETK